MASSGDMSTAAFAGSQLIPPSVHAHPKLADFLETVYEQYMARTPSASALLTFLASATSPASSQRLHLKPPTLQSRLVDHIAFRTLGAPAAGLLPLVKYLRGLGYELKYEAEDSEEPFIFKERGLLAIWMQHPLEQAPDIFISELLLEAKMFAKVKEPVVHLIRQGTDGMGEDLNWLHTLQWVLPTTELYEECKQTSEYLSWVLTYGYLPNHIAIDVQCLGLESLEDMHKFVEQAGLQINKPDSPVQCSSDGFLKQSSTRADTSPIEFTGGSVPLQVPAAFIEFVWREVLPGHGREISQLSEVESLARQYRRQGFDVGNANTIFSSTMETDAQKSAREEQTRSVQEAWEQSKQRLAAVC